ncbi:transposase [Carnobacterium maltaromaticum]|uniref:transposase n=1 Tax=Carnobacterium maltaromaticum TaxID=2751 RepID=UPI00191BACBA|nr:transposase [Carnobacterium maltaromaticum]
MVRLFKNQIEQYGVKDICIKRTYVLELLYIPMTASKNLTSNHLNVLFSHYPLCKKIIELVWQFKELFNEHQPELLDVRVQAVSKSPINQFNSFISSINQDYLAVTNAIIYDYNNGLAEGKVNKLKVAKRIMYGRNHFEALRNKLLWKEHN